MEEPTMNGDQEAYQPLPFTPVSMCTCNCTCKSVKSKRSKGLKRTDLQSGMNGNQIPPVGSTTNINWHINGNQLQEKGEFPAGYANRIPLSRQPELTKKVTSTAQTEDAEIQTEFVDLQAREKELNRLMLLLQSSRNALQEQQHRLQSNNRMIFRRKSDQSQQTELIPPCLPVPTFKDVITQQPLPSIPPFSYSQPTLPPPSQPNVVPQPTITTVSLATSISTTVAAVSTLRERMQVSLGVSQEKSNLISAAFIHRLKQRVQQRKEENALDGIKLMNEIDDSSEDEFEFQKFRRQRPRRLRGSSATRKTVTDSNRQSNINSSVITTLTSPKLSTSLAALSLRSSPPPPPAPSCTAKRINIQHAPVPPSTTLLKSFCQEVENLGSLTPSSNSASASLKRRVNFADQVQKDGSASSNQQQQLTSRPIEETDGAMLKIKPAIKKNDNCKDTDATMNGKRPIPQRSVAFVDEIDPKKLSNPDKDF